VKEAVVEEKYPAGEQVAPTTLQGIEDSLRILMGL